MSCTATRNSIGSARNRSTYSRGPSVSHSIAAAVFLASALPAAASANGLSLHHIIFQPSPTGSAVGYVIHLGTEPDAYAYSVDIGSPNDGDSEDGTLVYSASLRTEHDLYFALTTYDALGNASEFSNEYRLAAVAAPPPAPEPEPEPAPEPEPVAGIPGMRLGLTSDLSGMISILLQDGSAASLTMDSLAAGQDLRPTRCDLDSDGDLDVVLGFGSGSSGEIALIYLEDNAVSSLDSIVVGDATYRAKDGQTHPACGDVDGDGRPEIIVGMGTSADLHMQGFDDLNTAFAPLDVGINGLFEVPSTPRIRKLGAPLVPALGDIDGDGRDELVVGFARHGIRKIAILDDAMSAFTGHPNFTSGLPLIPIASTSDLDSRGGGTYPSVGDWDGDGLDEIVVGYGAGSDGWISFVDDAQGQEYDRYRGFLRIQVGRTDWRAVNGTVRPVFANIDEDEAKEIIIGFGESGSHEIQVFDDMIGGGMAFFRGGLGFVTSGDPEAKWMPAPGL